jgi:peptide deformylase
MATSAPAHPEILQMSNKKDAKTLRKKTAAFDFKKFAPKDVRKLVDDMRRIMREANGIGLSANQIGLDLRMFVAEVPDAQGGLKFYSLFNPEFEKMSDATVTTEEGCLSIPGVFGDVARSTQVTLKGFDKSGKLVKIKAWGLLARVFQHEMDHLNGKVFADRATAVHKEE